MKFIEMNGKTLEAVINDGELHGEDLKAVGVFDDTIVRVNQQGDIEVRRARNWDVIGGLLGFFVAGYTGVLLAVTNRPIWSDTPLLGMLFVISAASISAALLILWADRSAWRIPSLIALHRMDAWVVALELIVLIALIISLGPVARAWLNWWGLLLLLTVIIGMIVPLALYWRRGWLGELNLTTSAALILLGGFLLRVVIVFSSEAI